jgi:hypothetical protein
VAKRPPSNLYELRPVRTVRSETGADGKVTLLVPRFYNKLLVRFLVPRLKSPDVHLRLDAIGSFVWLSCDGIATVQAIAERAQQQFGGDAETMAARVAEFVAQLCRQRLLQLRAGALAAS